VPGGSNQLKAKKANFYAQNEKMGFRTINWSEGPKNKRKKRGKRTMRSPKLKIVSVYGVSVRKGKEYRRRKKAAVDGKGGKKEEALPRR